MSNPKEEPPLKKKDIPWKKGEMIGIGAYKTVYKGYNTALGTECCWNEVPIFGLDPKEHTKIFQEIMLLKSLSSPHIINIKDSWTEKDKIIFITDLLSSGTLKGYIKNIGKVSLQSVKRWSTQILRGISYLHERGIIHRDIKCENIFMNGIKGEIKIGDLGLSVIKDHAESRKLSVIGTTPFVAPELYKQDYNEKVDVYAFGMALLELVVGDYPYSECENDYQIIRKVTSHPMEPPEGLKRVADELLLEFIKKCILEDPKQRGSADELLTDPFLVIDESSDGEVFFTYEKSEKEKARTPVPHPIFDFRGKTEEEGEGEGKDPPKSVDSTTTDNNQEQEGERRKSDSKIIRPESIPEIVVSEETNGESSSKNNGHQENEETQKPNQGNNNNSNENEEVGEGKQNKSNQENDEQQGEKSTSQNEKSSSPEEGPENDGRPENEIGRPENGGSESGPEGRPSQDEDDPAFEKTLIVSSVRPKDVSKENGSSALKKLCKILIEQKSTMDSSLNVYLLITSGRSASPKEVVGEGEDDGEAELTEIAFPFNVKIDTAEEISKELYRTCAGFIDELSEKDVNLICEAIKRGLSSLKSSNNKRTESTRTNNDVEKPNGKSESKNDEQNGQKNNNNDNEEPNGQKESNGEMKSEEEEEKRGEEQDNNDQETPTTTNGGENENEPIDETPKLESLVKKMEELLFDESEEEDDTKKKDQNSDIRLK